MGLRELSILATGLGAVFGLLDKVAPARTAAVAGQPTTKSLQQHAIEYLNSRPPEAGFSRSNIRKGDLDAKIKLIMKMVNKYKTDPFVYDLATLIATNAGGRDQMAQLKMLHGIVLQNVQYVKDIVNLDTFQSPVQTLARARGDCDCFNILYLTVGAAMGIYGYAKVVRLWEVENGKRVPSPEWGHIYPVFEVGRSSAIGNANKYVPIDGTVPGYQVGQEVPSSYIAEWVVYDLTGRRVAASS